MLESVGLHLDGNGAGLQFLGQLFGCGIVGQRGGDGLSTGGDVHNHCGSLVIIYAALAENGFFPVEELKTHYANGSRLSGHVSHHVPGVDLSTGSLGHGLSVGVGMAYAAKKDGKKWKTYVVLGDGECNEGSVWEAAMSAAHYKLDNLVVIVDKNGLQYDGKTEDVMSMGFLTRGISRL